MVYFTRSAARRVIKLGIALLVIALVALYSTGPGYGSSIDSLMWSQDRTGDTEGGSLESEETQRSLMDKMEKPLVSNEADSTQIDYDSILSKRKQLLSDTLKVPITEPKTGDLVRLNDPRAGKAMATILCLARNEDIADVISSVQQLEEQFNGQFKYPYTFLNDEEFSDQFKDELIRLLPKGRKINFGKIASELWDMPDSIDRDIFKTKMEELGGIQDVEKVSYHNMCRFYSKTFYHHPLLQEYKYIWRLEPNVNFYCKIDYDVFQFMEDNDKIYGFVLNLYDSPESVRTLWSSTMNFVKKNPQYLHERGSYEWIKDNVQKSDNYEITGGYSTCHFWTNFEIINLDFLRSKPYEDFMSYLEDQKGFYYERWGDAPVRSLALALFADKSRIHWFRDIGYQHFPYTNCPKCPANSHRCNGNCKPGSFSPWPALEKENCLPVWIEHIMSKQELEVY